MTPYDTLTHWLNIFEAYRSKSFIDELLRIIQAWFANIKLRQMYILTWPAKAKRSAKIMFFRHNHPDQTIVSWEGLRGLPQICHN